MIRFTLAFIVVAVLAMLAAWLANHPGTVTVVWQGYRIEASLLILIASTLAVLVASLIIYRFWTWMRRGPTRLGEMRAADRRRRGFLALTQGLTAVAAGDSQKAGRYAQRAEALLDEPPLTLLLSAQAAQLSGDEASTTRHFTAMLESPETEFLGLRGLMTQAEREGDQERALKLSRRAYEKSPESPWVIQALFDLEVEACNWREAELLLKLPAATRALPDARAPGAVDRALRTGARGCRHGAMGRCLAPRPRGPQTHAVIRAGRGIASADRQAARQASCCASRAARKLGPSSASRSVRGLSRSGRERIRRGAAQAGREIDL